MDRFRGNLLIQFSITSFLITAAIAVVVSVILSPRLHENIELIEDHEGAMMAVTMI
jgi:hypothetical protein